MEENIIDVKKIFDSLENGVLAFSIDYQIYYTNRTALQITNNNKSILDIVNSEYHTILKNGVENKYAFFIKESPLKNKTVFNTTNSHYKIIVKPYEDNLYVMEMIEQTAIKKVNKFLIDQAMKNKKKLDILDKLVDIKKDMFSEQNVHEDDILALYDEQLHFELSIDAAISEIYETVLSQESSLKTVSKKVLEQMIKLSKSRFGIVYILNEEDNNIYNVVVEDSDDINFPYKDILPEELNVLGIDDKYQFLWHTLKTKEPFYINTMVNEYILKCLTFPMNFNNKMVGIVVLLNSAKDYTKQDVRAILRLGQLFSMAIWRIWNESVLKRLAMYDSMTGALNRWSGLKMFEKAIKKAKRYYSELTIAYIDINNLKKVNDAYGHIEGDWYIKTICSTINSIKRGTDDFIRLGGDEFLILFPDNKKSTDRFIKRTNDVINDIKQAETKEYDISFSVGIVEFDPMIHNSMDAYLEAADKVMYENKKKYKISLVINNPLISIS